MTDCRRLFLLFFLVTCTRGLHAANPAANPRQTGTPILRVWRAQDYAASPVNWRVFQHPASGFIYVANNLGVLEFDGATWRLIPLPRGGAARTLLLDAQGRVWAGGIGELARLAPDANGRMQIADLTEKIAAGASATAAAAPDGDETEPAAPSPGAEPLSGLGNLNRMAASADHVFIRLPDTIAQFSAGDAVQLIPARMRLGLIWWMDDRLHADNIESGLMQLDAGSIQSVPGVGRLGAYAARRMGSRWRLLTPQGIRDWDGPGHAPVTLNATADGLFQNETIYCATFLSDGRAAFGTTRSGVLIFDEAGRLSRQRIFSMSR